jgi:hypothetical protein
MSRSGYTDDCENLGLWRGTVERAIRGKRGQAALRELAAAMDAMPNKSLAAESLVTTEGESCTLGVLGQVRGLSMDPIDPDDYESVAKAFNLAPAMVREIVYENDEVIDNYKRVDVVICGPMRPYRYPHYERHERSVRVKIDEDVVAAKRWKHMRDWVEANLAKES